MNFTDRLEKWAAFMDVKSCQNGMVLINCIPEGRGQRPWPYRQQRTQRVDWAVADFHRVTEAANWLDDDSVAFVTPYTGTEIFAEAFGSQVYCSGDNMPFALPVIEDAKQLARLKQPRVEDSCLYELFEMAEAIRSRTDMRAPVQIPDIQSPVDVASLIWKKEDFLASMIEDPEAVTDLILMTEQLLKEFLDKWFAAFGTEYGAHFPLFPMRGGFTFSEDEIGEFSPQMFEQFCLPTINRLSDHFGGCAMHCCAFARHQWDGIKKIKGLRLLNLVQPQSVLEEAAAYFGTDVAHYHMVALEAEPVAVPLVPTWVSKLPKEAHIVLEANAATKEEALAKLAALRRALASRT